MITDIHGGRVDVPTALERLAPTGRTLAEHLADLLAATGVLAEAVLGVECDGPAGAGVVEALRAVLVAGAGVARQRGQPANLPSGRRPLTSRNPYVLLARLTQAAGAATASGEAVDVVLRLALSVADYYDVRAVLHRSIASAYRAYQQARTTQ